MEIASAAQVDPTWIKPVARLGYAARGVVYLVIAVFALSAAIRGGETEDTRGALEFMSSSAFGDVVVLVLIAGLAGYAIWRFIQAIFDPDHHGFDPKGLGVRAGLLASGFSYSVLTIFTFSLWRGADDGAGEGNGGAFAEFLSGLVGARPAAWLLAGVFLVVAVAHFVKALRKRYRDHIKVPPRFDEWLDPVAMTGLCARGLVFAVISILFFTRGIHGSGDGNDTPGLGDALDFIIGLPMGWVLLALMGAGLLAFSLYSITQALWRRVNVEDASLRLGAGR